ncbi:MAG: hypothetical protein ABIL05_00855 [candidate division WOR-3 bacterium]
MLFVKKEDKYVLDSSILMDGRIANLFEKKILSGKIIIPIEVKEGIEKGGNRKQRGLNTIERLQKCGRIMFVKTKGDGYAEAHIILKLAQREKAKVLTAADEIKRLAPSYQDVTIIDIRDIFLSLFPVYNTGDVLMIKILKRGKKQNEGVGYLEGGLKVIVDSAGDAVGKTIEVTVDSMLFLPTGNVVFAHPSAGQTNQQQ